MNMGSKTNKIYNKDNDKEEIEHQFKIIGEYLYVNRPLDMPGELCYMTDKVQWDANHYWVNRRG